MRSFVCLVFFVSARRTPVRGLERIIKVFVVSTWKMSEVCFKPGS